MRLTESDILDAKPYSDARTIFDRGNEITYHYKLVALATTKNIHGVYNLNEFSVYFNYNMNADLNAAICELFGSDSFLTKEYFCHKNKDCGSKKYPKICDYISTYSDFCNKHNLTLDGNLHSVFVGICTYDAISIIM